MSRTQSTRRLSLLAGSSLFAASLTATVGLTLPTAAVAQACTPNQATVSGPGADTVNCTGGSGAAGTYNPGITYVATGNLTVTTSGNITVSSSGGVPGVRTPNGVNLSATGADTLTFISAAEGSVVGGNVSGGAQTNGAVLDLLTQNGSISIITGQLAATNTGITHAILAQSTGTGAITIDARRGATLGTGTTIANVSIAAIEARTTTGAILISAGNATAVSAVSGGRRDSAVGILTQSDGAVTVNLLNTNLSGGAINSVSRGVSMRAAGAGSVELNIDWTLPLGTSASTYEATQRGLGGSLDFSGLSGGSTINIGEMASWEISGIPDTVLSSGNDTVNVGAGAYMLLRALNNIDTPNFPSTVAEDRYVINFGGGVNRLNNEGSLLVGVDNSQSGGAAVPLLSQPDRYEGELRLVNLTTFTNEGAIYLGARGLSSTGEGSDPKLIRGSDLWADDILAMPGTDFIGEAGSRLFMDVAFNSTGQESCDASLRATNGDLAADCIDLRGGSATGETLVTLGDGFSGDRGAYNPDGVVVVDLTGGSAEAGAFILDPSQPNYRTVGGQAYYDKGLFAYVLAYDEDKEQFRVYGVTAPVAQQYPLIATAASELWRAAAGSWLEQRQTGLPGAEREPGVGGGVWMRVSGASIQRDVVNSIGAGVTTLDFDNSYDQRNLTVTVGADLMGGDLGSASWAVGGMAGYARSELEFDQSANIDNLEGAHAGLYGALTAGSFFLDASVNGTWLTMDSDAPALNLFPAGRMVGGGISSLGVQAEAGWRLEAGPLSIEPLASLSYVRTTVDDLEVPAADPIRFGGRVEFDEVTSLRGGLGVRLGMTDIAPGFAPTNLSLTARAINETDGEVLASVVNIGPLDAPVTDALDGMFSEVTGAVSVTNSSQTVAGYLNVGGVFGSDYQSVNVSAGFRYQW